MENNRESYEHIATSQPAERSLIDQANLLRTTTKVRSIAFLNFKRNHAPPAIDKQENTVENVAANLTTRRGEVVDVHRGTPISAEK